jgi:hypothetical protein
MNRRSLRIAAAVIAIASFAITCQEISAKQLFWADGGIKRANLDGTSITPLVNHPVGRFAIADNKSTVYYGGLDVRKLTPQTGDDSFLFDVPDYSIFSSIAIDPIRSNLYIVEAMSSTIFRTDLDGANAATVIPGDGQFTNTTRIEHVQIDPLGGKLYWSQYTPPYPPTKSFRRSNLDGSQQELLFNVSDYIMDFAVEPISGRIYWTSSQGWPNSGAVWRANYDGSNREQIASGLWGPYALALDAEQGKVYFSDSWTSGPTAYDNTLRVANLDGSDPRILINFGPMDGAYDLSIGDLVPEPASAGLATTAWFALFACRRRSRPPGRL